MSGFSFVASTPGNGDGKSDASAGASGFSFVAGGDTTAGMFNTPSQPQETTITFHQVTLCFNTLTSDTASGDNKSGFMFVGTPAPSDAAAA